MGFQEAKGLWEKIQARQGLNKWRPDLEEEYEDQEGNIYNKKTPFKIELLLTQSGKLWRSGKQYVEVTVDDLMGSGFYVGDRNYLKIIGRELVVSGYDDRSSFVDYLAGRAVALVTHNKHLDTFRKI